MIFFDMLYYIFIYPIVYFLQVLFYSFGVHTRSDNMVTLLFVTIVMNIIILPLYNAADKLKESESKIYDIKRYNILSFLKSNLDMLIQIILLLASYKFFFSLDAFKITNFMSIANMGEPDGLFAIGDGKTINVLPFAMTFFSLLSAFVYTKIVGFKKSIPLYAMSLFFLVFLYNSPAALLVYWVINFAFLFARNIVIYNKKVILSLKNKLTANKKFIKILGMSILILFAVYTIAIAVMTFFYFMPVLLKVHVKTYIDLIAIWFVLVLAFLLKKYANNIIIDKLKLEDKLRFNIFLLSSVALTILIGLFIPSTLVGSSAQEFENPYTLIFTNFFIYIGIFFVYAMGLYFLLSDKFKSVITFFVSSLSLLAIINVFIFPGDYGVIDADFIFNDAHYIKASLLEIVFSTILTLSIFFIVFLFYRFKKTKILSHALSIGIITLASLSVYEFTKINREQGKLAFIDEYAKVNEGKSDIFNFSKTGKNILVIVLDRGGTMFVDEAFKRIPYLKDSFDGFIFYTNTIAFSGSTFPGAQTIYGGYEYSPYEIYASGTNYDTERIHNEALLMMPKLFSDIGYGATMVDPVYASFSWIPDISIFAPYTNINAYLADNLGKIQNKVDEVVDEGLLELGITNTTDSGYNQYRLSRFTLFRILPIALRNVFYSDGDWYIPDVSSIVKGYSRGSANSIFEYSVLLAMEEMSVIKESNNYFNMMHNNIIHNAMGFSPNYKPSVMATEVSEEDLKYFISEFSARSYYSHVAALEALTDYFNFLKENDVYDNTKIIIVSDHAFPGFTTINNNSYELASLRVLNAVLLVKDFNSKGELKADGNFMTIGDVPYLATKHLKEPKNPFTGKIITNDYKRDGVNIVSLSKWWPLPIYDVVFYFHVKDNIFDTNNWTKIEE